MKEIWNRRLHRQVAHNLIVDLAMWKNYEWSIISMLSHLSDFVIVARKSMNFSSVVSSL